MPRYFFHVHDGDKFVDLQGTELPDLQSARKEAVRFAAALLIDKSEEFWNSSEWTMRVTDADDLTLYSLLFMATGSPAVSK